MLDDDLTIDGGSIKLKFESDLAKDCFTASLLEMHEKIEEIKSQNCTCGDCAAYLCFRNHKEDASAGLCYQEVRQCRQECGDFIQKEGSGKSPLFIITGICKKDDSKVVYGHECKSI